MITKNIYQRFTRDKLSRELESSVLICLLQNGYEAKEADQITDMMVQYFYNIQPSTRILK
jgi:hypothetical protein